MATANSHRRPSAVAVMFPGTAADSIDFESIDDQDDILHLQRVHTPTPSLLEQQLTVQEQADQSLEYLIAERHAENAWAHFAKHYQQQSQQEQSRRPPFTQIISLINLLGQRAIRSHSTTSRIQYLYHLVQHDQLLPKEHHQLLMALLSSHQLSLMDDHLTRLDHLKLLRPSCSFNFTSSSSSLPEHEQPLRYDAEYYYARLLEAYLAQWRRVDLALDLFKRMRVRHIRHHASLTTTTPIHHPTSAYASLTQETEQHAGVDDPLGSDGLIDDRIFSAFISGFAKLGDIPSAVGFLKAKSKAGFEPSVRDYAALVRGYLLRDDEPAAKELYQNAVRRLTELRSARKGGFDGHHNKTEGDETIELDLEMLYGYAYLKDTTQAQTYYDKVLSKTTQFNYLDRARTNYLWSLTRCADLSAATSFFQQLKHQGVVPNHVCLALMLDLFVKSGRYLDAQAIFKGHQRLGHQPNVYAYSMLMNAFRKQGDIDSMLSLMEEMHDRGIAPNQVTYTTLMQGYAQNRMFESAVQIYRAMKSRQVPIDAVACLVVLNGAARAQQFQYVMEVYEDLCERHLEFTPEAFKCLIYAHGQRGDMVKARALFDDMEAKGIKRDIMAYNALLSGHILNHDLTSAFEVVKMIKRDQVQPDMGTYRMLIEMSSREGRMDNVLKFLNLLIKDHAVPFIPDSLLSQVLRILSSHGDLEMVRMTFYALKQGEASRSRVRMEWRSWSQWIRCLITHAKWEEAKRVLEELAVKKVKFGEQGAAAIVRPFKQAYEEYQRDLEHGSLSSTGFCMSGNHGSDEAGQKEGSIDGAVRVPPPPFEHVLEQVEKAHPGFWDRLNSEPVYEVRDRYLNGMDEPVSEYVYSMFSDAPGTSTGMVKSTDQ